MRSGRKGVGHRRIAGEALVLLLGGAAPALAQRRPEPVDMRTYPVQKAAEPEASAGPERWTEREVEHLLNRAAFGARTGEIHAWSKRSPAELVDWLLLAEDDNESFYVERLPRRGPAVREMSEREKRAYMSRVRESDRRQLLSYVGFWFDRMLTSEAPLRERMTLFWHGLFTSSYTVVRRSELMIQQNELFRSQALGSYATLLREILRDPAMLLFLDNDESKKEHPNENLARELFELFSLGEGNYSEQDVKEAARALTGRTVAGGYYVYERKAHDGDPKQILGYRGNFGGNQLVDLILRNPACPRYIAGRLIAWFEGLPPSAERLERYAKLLADRDYEIQPFLRELFLDPDFYRPEVLGARVASPVDFLVGSSRRLGLEPPPAFLASASGMLGQALLDPPSVKGWDEGLAWITTASLMQRANLIAALLDLLTKEQVSGGQVDEELLAALEESSSAVYESDSEEEPTESMEPEDASGERKEARPVRGGLGRIVGALKRIRYRPKLHLSERLSKAHAESDAEVVAWLADEILAIEPPAETLTMLTAAFAAMREEAGIAEGALLAKRTDPEPLLRRLAHRILSLPEGQLE